MRIEEQASVLVRDTPRSMLDEAIQDVINEDDCYWRSAELAIWYRENTDAPVSACNMAAGLIYRRSESSIRDRVRVYHAVPEGLREELEFLTSSYWRECAVSDDLQATVDRANQVSGHYYAYGKLPSIDTVRSWWNNEKADLVWRQRLGSVKSLIEKIIADPQTNRQIVRACDLLLRRINSA